jgi:hypothetical protein
MTRLIRTLVLTLAAGCGLLAHAQEESTDEQLALVPQALKEAQYVNKVKPNLKAKIYFIYQSRSTCGICVSEAPTLVKEYKKMKRGGCEMVMLNVDATPKAAEQWVKKAKMTFPVMSPAMSMSSGIPWTYAGRPLLPCMIAVTPDGTKIAEAGGSDVSDFVKDWKKLLRDHEKEANKKKLAEKKSQTSKKKGKKKKSGIEEEEEED